MKILENYNECFVYKKWELVLELLHYINSVDSWNEELGEIVMNLFVYEVRIILQINVVFIANTCFKNCSAVVIF